MRKWTILIIGISTALLILWDLAAFIFSNNATISVVMTDWSFYTPWIPFLWGFLMGHWFAAPAGSKKEHVGD